MGSEETKAGQGTLSFVSNEGLTSGNVLKIGEKENRLVQGDNRYRGDKGRYKKWTNGDKPPEKSEQLLYKYTLFDKHTAFSFNALDLASADGKRHLSITPLVQIGCLGEVKVKDNGFSAKIEGKVSATYDTRHSVIADGVTHDLTLSSEASIAAEASFTDSGVSVAAGGFAAPFLINSKTKIETPVGTAIMNIDAYPFAIGAAANCEIGKTKNGKIVYLLGAGVACGPGLKTTINGELSKEASDACNAIMKHVSPHLLPLVTRVCQMPANPTFATLGFAQDFVRIASKEIIKFQESRLSDNPVAFSVTEENIKNRMEKGRLDLGDQPWAVSVFTPEVGTAAAYHNATIHSAQASPLALETNYQAPKTIPYEHKWTPMRSGDREMFDNAVKKIASSVHFNRQEEPRRRSSPLGSLRSELNYIDYLIRENSEGKKILGKIKVGYYPNYYEYFAYLDGLVEQGNQLSSLMWRHHGKELREYLAISDGVDLGYRPYSDVSQPPTLPDPSDSALKIKEEILKEIERVHFRHRGRFFPGLEELSKKSYKKAYAELKKGSGNMGGEPLLHAYQLMLDCCQIIPGSEAEEKRIFEAVKKGDFSEKKVSNGEIQEKLRSLHDVINPAKKVMKCTCGDKHCHAKKNEEDLPLAFDYYQKLKPTFEKLLQNIIVAGWCREDINTFLREGIKLKRAFADRLIERAQHHILKKRYINKEEKKAKYKNIKSFVEQIEKSSKPELEALAQHTFKAVPKDQYLTAQFENKVTVSILRENDAETKQLIVDAWDQGIRSEKFLALKGAMLYKENHVNELVKLARQYPDNQKLIFFTAKALVENPVPYSNDFIAGYADRFPEVEENEPYATISGAEASVQERAEPPASVSGVSIRNGTVTFGQDSTLANKEQSVLSVGAFPVSVKEQAEVEPNKDHSEKKPGSPLDEGPAYQEQNQNNRFGDPESEPKAYIEASNNDGFSGEEQKTIERRTGLEASINELIEATNECRNKFLGEIEKTIPDYNYLMVEVKDALFQAKQFLNELPKMLSETLFEKLTELQLEIESLEKIKEKIKGEIQKAKLVFCDLLASSIQRAIKRKYDGDLYRASFKEKVTYDLSQLPVSNFMSTYIDSGSLLVAGKDLMLDSVADLAMLLVNSHALKELEGNSVVRRFENNSIVRHLQSNPRRGRVIAKSWRAGRTLLKIRAENGSEVVDLGNLKQLKKSLVLTMLSFAPDAYQELAIFFETKIKGNDFHCSEQDLYYFLEDATNLVGFVAEAAIYSMFVIKVISAAVTMTMPWTVLLGLGIHIIYCLLAAKEKDTLFAENIARKAQDFLNAFMPSLLKDNREIQLFCYCLNKVALICSVSYQDFKAMCLSIGGAISNFSKGTIALLKIVCESGANYLWEKYDCCDRLLSRDASSLVMQGLSSVLPEELARVCANIVGVIYEVGLDAISSQPVSNALSNTLLAFLVGRLVPEASSLMVAGEVTGLYYILNQYAKGEEVDLVYASGLIMVVPFLTGLYLQVIPEPTSSYFLASATYELGYSGINKLIEWTSSERSAKGCLKSAKEALRKGDYQTVYQKLFDFTNKRPENLRYLDTSINGYFNELALREFHESYPVNLLTAKSLVPFTSTLTSNIMSFFAMPRSVDEEVHIDIKCTGELGLAPSADDLSRRPFKYDTSSKITFLDQEAELEPIDEEDLKERLFGI
jgi:hypothetical protein